MVCDSASTPEGIQMDETAVALWGLNGAGTTTTASGRLDQCARKSGRRSTGRYTKFARPVVSNLVDTLRPCSFSWLSRFADQNHVTVNKPARQGELFAVPRPIEKENLTRFEISYLLRRASVQRPCPNIRHAVTRVNVGHTPPSRHPAQRIATRERRN